MFNKQKPYGLLIDWRQGINSEREIKNELCQINVEVLTASTSECECVWGVGL